MAKIATDIEQSKKLAKFLPLESADMRWTSFDEKWDAYLGAPNPYAIKKEIPCWSLVALLSVLPKYIGGYSKCLYYDGGNYYCGYMDGGDFMLTIEETNADNPIDTCVKMIIKLYENNLL